MFKLEKVHIDNYELLDLLLNEKSNNFDIVNNIYRDYIYSNVEIFNIADSFITPQSNLNINVLNLQNFKDRIYDLLQLYDKCLLFEFIKNKYKELNYKPSNQELIGFKYYDLLLNLFKNNKIPINYRIINNNHIIYYLNFEDL